MNRRSAFFMMRVILIITNVNIKIIGVIKNLSQVKNPKMDIPNIIKIITSETIFCVLNIK